MISDRNELIQALKYNLRRMSTNIVLLTESIEQKLGINDTDVKCAEIIFQKGPMTAGKLAKLSELSTGAITSVIDRLEGAGWVQRVADPNDRRKVIIRAIPEKPHPIEGLYDSLSNQIDQLLNSFNNNQLSIILNFVKRYSEITI
ncbi:MAG: MarR family transcriptional regulator [Candidatus Lokiarchaeota archaeon]